MTINYGEAAARHLADAFTLHDRKRFPSADHLCGLAAECALKVALRKGANGNVEERFLCHIDTLWDRVPLQYLGPRYRTLTTLLRSRRPGPFANWSINQRYCDGSGVTQAVSEAHLSAARRLCGAVGLLGGRGSL